MANFVEIYEIIKPNMYNIEDQLEKVFRDCRYKCFISFKKMVLYIFYKQR